LGQTIKLDHHPINRSTSLNESNSFYQDSSKQVTKDQNDNK